ncbi:hypothetical protein BJ741DRAFT_432066 [Chytriomyces cf. hyalinus JEL632]|nr:hypothetical protein BJ741DRAFT_432066 [Chytriomyces cf. hyalinus JEL632]
MWSRMLSWWYRMCLVRCSWRLRALCFLWVGECVRCCFVDIEWAVGRKLGAYIWGSMGRDGIQAFVAFRFYVVWLGCLFWLDESVSDSQCRVVCLKGCLPCGCFNRSVAA